MTNQVMEEATSSLLNTRKSKQITASIEAVFFYKENNQYKPVISIFLKRSQEQG